VSITLIPPDKTESTIPLNIFISSDSSGAPYLVPIPIEDKVKLC